jgi:lipopolysaccharide export system protein LptC
MAVTRPDTHSRIVALAKILLPLAALAILSSLFLFARVIDPADAIPYANVDIDDYARDPRLTRPTYAGSTADGTSITLTADEARPAQGGATAEGVRATLIAVDGATTQVQAARAALDRQQLKLDGGVSLASPAGLTILTDAVTVNLDRTGVTSGPVTAEGRLGTLTAQAMDLRPDGNGHLLHFTGGVRLVYTPQPR